MLRPATIDDMELVWQWRNDPVTCEMSFTSEEIPWYKHVEWYTSMMNDPKRHLLIYQISSSPIAVIRLDVISCNEAEISINLSPDKRGKGLGKEAIRKTIELTYQLGYKRLIAKVKPQNTPSLGLFRGEGFRITNESMHSVTLALDLPDLNKDDT